MSLKEQVITNVWKCDKCEDEQTVDIDPFYAVAIRLPNNEAVHNIDICSDCAIATTIQDLIGTLE